METYDDLCNTQDFPVVFADNNGIITAINDAFAAAFSWERDRLVNQPLTVIMPEHFKEPHTMGFSRFVTSQVRKIPEHALELEVVCGDGSVLVSSHTIVVERIGSEWCFAGRIVPVVNA